MSEFAVGMKVVCIDDDWDQILPCETVPKKGGVYTIRVIEAGSYDDEDDLYLEFAEIHNPIIEYADKEGEASFPASDFRPLEEKSDSIELFREIARGVSDGKPIIEDTEYRLPTPEKVRA